MVIIKDVLQNHKMWFPLNQFNPINNNNNFLITAIYNNHNSQYQLKDHHVDIVNIFYIYIILYNIYTINIIKINFKLIHKEKYLITLIKSHIANPQ